MDNGDLWVLYSRFRKRDGGNDVYAKRVPASDLPSDPGGWTDKGRLYADARDPCVGGITGGWNYLVAKDERAPGVVCVDGVDIADLSRDNTQTVFTNSFSEAPELVPKTSGDGV